MPSEFTIV
uniref:Uncharacterized protein n=1 Tax=Arundo donax TaxID=35708 RepID=A0A0A9HHQ1_ARUDO